MTDKGGCNTRNERRVSAAAAFLGALAGLGLCGAAACSDGSDVTYQVNGNAAAPGEGALTGNPIPSGPIPSGPVPPADGLGGPTPPAPQASGASAPPIAPENPPPAPGSPEEAPSTSGGEPQPSATETNFFGAGCRSDADCGENRRCEFPVDLEPDAAPSPARADAGSADAGADAAVPETLVPRGHCVAR